MLFAFDTITQRMVSANDVSNNKADEPFRYECLCCGEEVHIAAKQSTKMVPHFRHLHGNSDKDCELYLGSLLQAKTGIDSAVNAAKRRTHSNSDFYFNITQKLFYFSVSFSEEKIKEYQAGEYELQIKDEANQVIKPLLINQSNFAPDAPIMFPLRLSSNSCKISIHSRKSSRDSITSYCELLKQVDFPTLFKYKADSNDSIIAKRQTDGVIYTDTRYYAVALQKSHIEKLFPYYPDISVGSIDEIPALGSILFGAEIIISSVSDELRDLMHYFGYELRLVERITMLWPPAYTVDGEIRCPSERLFLSSTYELRPRSNVSCDFERLSSIGQIYVIEYSDKLRISHTDGTTVQITSEKDQVPILPFSPLTETAVTVEADGARNYYYIGADGCRLLPAGRYFLTKAGKIVRCQGNYPEVIYVAPELGESTQVKRLMDVRKYYNVMIPYDDSLISGIQLSKVAEIYIENCRATGAINAKALEYIKAGTI